MTGIKINDHIHKKISFGIGTEWDSFRRKNLNVNQIFYQNYSQIYIISKYIKKETDGRPNDFL